MGPRRTPQARLRGLLLAGGMVIAAALPATAADLRIILADTGAELARLPLPDPPEWCVLWRHSVKGFEVSDCYAARDGRMVLVRSHQPDFAAGLGHIEGRGTLTGDGFGGYIIDGIDEAVPGNAYILRPGGPAVDHRIRTAGAEISLTRLAQRQRVLIALVARADTDDRDRP